jgi:aminoacrylate hydrolase
VFVSGLGGLGSFWSAQVQHFSPTFRVLTFDHRGVGRSEGAPPYSVLQWSHDILTLLDHVGAKKVHLVGHSTGGIIGQAFAAVHPDRLHSLVLCGTWLRPDVRFRELFALRQRVLMEMGADAYRTLGDLLAAPDSFQPQPSAPMTSQMRHTIVARIDALLGFDGTAMAPRIATPTFVLAAKDDYIVPAYMSDAVAAAIPASRRVSFASGGHFFPKTRASEYNAALADFWAEAGR